MAFLLLTLAAFALATPTNHPPKQAPTVKLLNGTYRGVHSTQYNQDYFLGIPFAQPPLGNLRFRNPQPLNESWSDTRQATEYKPECYGYGSDQWVLGNRVSEDCLTINVVRPSGEKDLPVFAWIHGGGYYQGGNSDPRYNLSFIVERSVKIGKPIIGVQFNYRLAQFGFLYGSEIEAEGGLNLGLKDQRLALHWVKENIAAFGGDPTRTTIAGESAGGGSVAAQLTAYGGRDDGLFRGAIQQSGSAMLGYSPPNNTIYNRILDAAGCSNLACLRTKTSDELSTIFNSSVTRGGSSGPIIDGDFIQELGSVALNNGRFVKVPLINGANNDEGTAFGPRGINTTEQFLRYISAAGPDNATALTIAAVYPDIPEIGIPGTVRGRIPSQGYMYKRTSAYGGDLTMHAPRRFTNQAWAKQNTTSYAYNFNVLTNGLPATVGATHFQEVAFVFDNKLGLGYENAVAKNPFAGKPQTYFQLADLMSSMWISFVHDLNPSFSNVQWPVYTVDDAHHILFDTNITSLAQSLPDTYRAEGIKYISDHFASAYRK